MDTKSATPTQARAQDMVLLPCPFCGNDKPSQFRHHVLQEETCVVCRVCFANATLATKWNRRAPWRPMSSAPVGDVKACIDIWSGDDCRITDCFWDVHLARWAAEVFTDSGDYRTVRVADPVAWMPAPGRPEGV
jgi:hypothetical protein